MRCRSTSTVQYQCPTSCRRCPSSVRYGSASCTRSASRCGSLPSARSIVTTPSACPVVTGFDSARQQVEREPVRGHARAWSSWNTSRRFAASVAANAASAAVSPSDGRVRVSAQLPHERSVRLGEPVAVGEFVVGAPRDGRPDARRGRRTPRSKPSAESQVTTAEVLEEDQASTRPARKRAHCIHANATAFGRFGRLHWT